MRILIVLNGSNLRRWNSDLPDRLRAAAAERGERPTIVVTRSLQHMDAAVGRAVEAGVDVVFAGGGDGTLHHIVNHPMGARAALAMLPVGTINAFLRSIGTDVSRPVEAFRQLLAGRIEECPVGRLNGRRFACFASWGFDARVVHTNPPALKRTLRAASYGVTGVKELLCGNAHACPGRMIVQPGAGMAMRATSVIVSKIGNYAGVHVFATTVREPEFEALYVDGDSPGRLLALWATMGARGITGRRAMLIRGAKAIPRFQALRWQSRAPAHVQLDGEVFDTAGARKLEIDVDPEKQRYLLPG